MSACPVHVPSRQAHRKRVASTGQLAGSAGRARHVLLHFVSPSRVGHSSSHRSGFQQMKASSFLSLSQALKIRLPGSFCASAARFLSWCQRSKGDSKRQETEAAVRIGFDSSLSNPNPLSLPRARRQEDPIIPANCSCVSSGC